MWDGFDKRKFPRINVRCDIFLQFGENPPPLSTVTENLGVGGVCVILEKPLARFESCRVRLLLEDRQPPVDCSGRVMWVVRTRPIKGRLCYDIGIEFLDLDESFRKRIEALVDSYQSTQETSRKKPAASRKRSSR